MIQMALATHRAPFRPQWSEIHPAAMAPTKEPADMEAVMPPCSVEPGLLK